MFLKYTNNNKLILLINTIHFNKNSSELLKKIKEELELLIEELYFEEITIDILNSSIIVTNKAEEFEDLKDMIYLLSKLQITLLLKGILINGGLTIGEFYYKENIFTEKSTKDFFDFLKDDTSLPRIIISEELEKCLNEFNENEKLTLDFKEFNSTNDIYDINYLSEEEKSYTTVEEIKYLLKLDRDKILYINYLKECLYDYLEAEKDSISFKKENLTIEDSFDCKSDFYDYYFKHIIVKIKKVIFNGLNTSNDMNIILKYLWLKDYYNSTLNILDANSNNKAYIVE